MSDEELLWYSVFDMNLVDDETAEHESLNLTKLGPLPVALVENSLPPEQSFRVPAEVCEQSYRNSDGKSWTILPERGPLKALAPFDGVINATEEVSLPLVNEHGQDLLMAVNEDSQGFITFDGLNTSISLSLPHLTEPPHGSEPQQGSSIMTTIPTNNISFRTFESIQLLTAPKRRYITLNMVAKCKELDAK